MKRFINGTEVDLAEQPNATVTQLPDRLIVKTDEGAHSGVAVRLGDKVLVSYRGRTYTIEKAVRAARAGAAATGEMHAPMPGLIVDVLVAEGATVSKGNKILVLEAMKTQQAFTAPFDGVVAKLPVSKGQQVAEGALLASLTPNQRVEGVE